MRKICLALLILFSACQFSTKRENDEADRKEAEKVVTNFYDYLSEKKIAEATKLFHPSLLQANDTAKFRQFLLNISMQMPFLKERKLDHWQTKVAKGLETGSFYSLYYVNKLEGGELKVSITLMKNENDSIRITGYQANPDKFL